MSRILGVTLLLIILVDSFYDSTALSDGFCVTKVKHIRKCRVFPNGVIKCQSPLLPTNREKMDLIKCLCSKTNQHKFPGFEAICTSGHPGFPITLV